MMIRHASNPNSHLFSLRAVEIAIYIIVANLACNYQSSIVNGFVAQFSRRFLWTTVTTKTSPNTERSPASTHFLLSERDVTTSLHAYPPRKKRGNNKNSESNSKNKNDDNIFDPVLDEPQGRRGNLNNWIEKSSPSGITLPSSASADANEKSDTTDGNYDLCISGESFSTGPLSLRMFNALIGNALKRFPPGTDIDEVPTDLLDMYMKFSMDSSAKEAVKAALDQNGLTLVEEEGVFDDNYLWGEIDTVRLLDVDTLNEEEEMYDSFDEAVQEGNWEPGQGFNFIVRNVPAKLKEMDLEQLLKALDPEGALREEAKEKGMTMPDEDPESLNELGKDCERRSNIAPREIDMTDKDAHVGDGSRGYQIIDRNELSRDFSQTGGATNDETLMHVMNAFVSHGCIIVDLTDGGKSVTDALKITKMWDVVEKFYDSLNSIESTDSNRIVLPTMDVADGAGSPHAVTGFGSYDGGNMQFLETRIQRNNGGGDERLIPKEVESLIGKDGVTSIIEAFRVMCDVGKDLVKVAVEASSIEANAFLDADLDEGDFISDMEHKAVTSASHGAGLLTDELLDDGLFTNLSVEEGSISMSPHRLCRYVGTQKKNMQKSKSGHEETFGAHTDTSFVTIVPVAEVSGLEVFDEEANKWFKPELRARKMWEKEQDLKGLDPMALSETVYNSSEIESESIEIPWHSRYLVIMPGELLQLCTRNEIPAAVHRVVTVTGGAARLSAPALLRARPGMAMNVERYMGSLETAGPLLTECDGMSMEEIHNRLQPSSFR